MVFGILGLLCALIGLFLINGISIEFPGIILAVWATTSACKRRPGWESGGTDPGDRHLNSEHRLHHDQRPLRFAAVRVPTEGWWLEKGKRGAGRAGAKAILDLNWTGEYTQPGPRLYPHQWSWDSPLIALAYAHYDPGRAEKELRYLFEANGRTASCPRSTSTRASVTTSPDPASGTPRRARTHPNASRPRAW
jgi:hypothetical protein